MPPHLHPRSRYTSSLFATTLLASFLVVGIPHILPCPVPRVAYADGEMNEDGTRRRRRRRKCDSQDVSQAEGTTASKRDEGVGIEKEITIEGQTETRRQGRECPVPRPPGILGDILGFKNDRNGKGSGDSKSSGKGIP